MNDNISRSSRKTTISLHLLFALGLLIALLGAGIDYVLPGRSPGINLPQLLVIAAGLALSLGAHQLRRENVRRKLAAVKAGNLPTALLISTVTLFALEIVLSILDVETYIPADVSVNPVEPVDWQACDEAGCHYDRDAMTESCRTGEIEGRLCLVNMQGFGDSQDFVYDDDLEARTRVLMLGDSYTQGFSADLGKSYVETVEAKLPEIVVWNAAVAGEGTQQAIASFKAFAPVLRPNLVILGFYMNDFIDNLYPVGSYVAVRDSENRLFHTRQFRLDRWGNLSRSEVDSISFRDGKSIDRRANQFERQLGTTRLGTIVLRALDRLGSTLRTDVETLRRDKTREYLRELRNLAAQQNIKLLVLLIPSAKDLGAPGAMYQSAVQIVSELALSYMEPINLPLRSNDHVLPSGGLGHWNNSGHQKVGVLLSDCIEAFVASGNLGDCEGVVVPLPR